MSELNEIKLPDKMSELLRVAVDDLEKIEADPNYRINMAQWHSPSGAYCEVCLAGATLATRGIPSDVEIDPSIPIQSLEGRKVYDKLCAINSLRTGSVKTAAEYMGITDTARLNNITHVAMTRYEHGPENFKRELRDLANDLEKYGY